MDASVLLSVWFGHGRTNTVFIGGSGAKSLLSNRAETAMKELIDAGYVLASRFNDHGRMQYTGTDKCLGLRLPFSELERYGKWSLTKSNTERRGSVKGSNTGRNRGKSNASNRRQPDKSGRQVVSSQEFTNGISIRGSRRVNPLSQRSSVPKTSSAAR
jgi:hypothetical protein